PALVEVQLACGDLVGALEGTTRLEKVADVYGTVLLAARAATCRAQLALTQGAAHEAMACARTAVNLWRDAGAPYETAQTQHLLAHAAAASGDQPVAVL